MKIHSLKNLAALMCPLLFASLAVWAQTTTTTTIGSPTTTTIGDRRYLASIFNSASQATGLSVVNLSPSPVTLLAVVRSPGLTGTGGTLTLLPGHQFVGVLQELFPLGVKTGWFYLESSSRVPEGFFLLFDYNLTVMAGSLLSSASAGSVIPLSDAVELTLVNPLYPVDAAGTLEFIDESGVTTSSLPLSLGALDQMTMPLDAKGGYVRYRAIGHGMVPLAVVHKAGWIAALEPFNLFTAEPTTLYAPQYAAGGGFTSVMDIINLESSTTTLSLKLIGDDGLQIGTTGSVALQPQGSARISDPAIFGIAAGSKVVQGYVQAQSTGGHFAAWVRFSDAAERKFGTVLRFVSGTTKGYFLQVAQNDLFYTGLASLNPNPQATTATITVYDTSGTVLRIGNFQIPPGGRFSKLLPELVQDLPQLSKGYFSITSNLPLASVAVFGTNSGDLLCAVTPVTIPAPTTPTTTLRSSTTTFPATTTSRPLTTTTTSTTTTTT